MFSPSFYNPQQFGQPNPYTQPNPYAQAQQQAQPIQTIPQQTQKVVCYSVSGKGDMQNLDAFPNVYYVGINNSNKEIYVKTMNNNGIIDLDTYVLSKGEQESSNLKVIMDKLESIELKLKETENEHTRNDATVAEYAKHGGSSKRPNDAGISTNDARQKSTATNTNSSEPSSVKRF